MESLCDSTIIEVVPWFGTVAGAIVFIIIMGLYNSIFFSLEKNEPVSYAKILGGQKKEELEQALPGFGINFIAHIPVFFRFMSYIFFNKESGEEINKLPTAAPPITINSAH